MSDASGSQRTCGGCSLFVRQPQDLKSGACFGVPPTPILVAARPGPTGMQFQFENIRPVLDQSTMACGLYRARLAVQQPFTQTPDRQN